MMPPFRAALLKLHKIMLEFSSAQSRLSERKRFQHTQK
jgi:hypothetical protein